MSTEYVSGAPYGKTVARLVQPAAAGRLLVLAAVPRAARACLLCSLWALLAVTVACRRTGIDGGVERRHKRHPVSCDQALPSASLNSGEEGENPLTTLAGLRQRACRIFRKVESGKLSHEIGGR